MVQMVLLANTVPSESVRAPRFIALGLLFLSKHIMFEVNVCMVHMDGLTEKREALNSVIIRDLMY